MQTKTSRGMQTMEQALADLIQRGVVNFEVGLTRSSRPEQLIGLLERAGFPVDLPPDLSTAAGRAAARRRTTRRRELVMDDQPLWKKEVSFGRSPRRRTTRASRRLTDEPSAPAFKQELSFKRGRAGGDAVERAGA